MLTKLAIPVCMIFTLLFPGAVLASDAGTTSADFLKLGVGPRAVAMGDAQVGLADDVYSTFWNPAGLARLSGQQAGFVFTQYLQNINEQYLAYALPRGLYGTLGLSLTYLGVGSFQGYDAVGQPTSSVGANDLAFGVSYSHYLYYDPRTSAGLSAGLTGKWIQERLDNVSATAYAADLGLLYSPGLSWGEFFDGWKAGLALRNLGSAMQFDQESFPLPRVFTAGTSYTGHLWNESITLALDGRQPNDGPQSVGIGLEILTLDALVLRGGYTSQGDLGNGLSVGAGIKFKTLQFDYAFTSAGDLGVTNRIGITVKFAPPPQDHLNLAQQWYDRGKRDYRKGRYSNALGEFNKALEIDPTHPEALDMMKKTYENIKVLAPAQ